MGFSASVLMPDNSVYQVKRLLGKAESNTKLNKSDKAEKGFMTVGLSLAPAKASGFNLCTSASGACIKSCIYTSGHAAIFRTIQPARIAKSRLFRMNKDVFVTQLMQEVRNVEKVAIRKGLKLACRLNVFSDVEWEREYPEIYETFPKVQFYDYTKHYSRMLAYARKELPRNLHLTFSWSGTNKDECVSILDRGSNVAVPFNVKYFGEKRQPLPKKFMGYTVIDGDITDLRFLDRKARKGKQGYIVGLRAKGKGRKDLTSGFIVQPNESEIAW